MHPNRSLYFIISFAVTLSLLTAGFTVVSPAMASSKGGGGGSVTQEKVSTGNSGLDKNINSFYSCISKTHQDPPTIEKVDNCYYQAVGGESNSGGVSNITPGGTSSTSTAGFTNSHHHKHGESNSSGGVSNITPGGTSSTSTAGSTNSHQHKH